MTGSAARIIRALLAASVMPVPLVLDARVWGWKGISAPERVRDQVDGDGPAGARAIVDHDVLPERLADPFEHDAGNEIHHAGGSERHNRANGPRRKIIGARVDVNA